jgi:hypothetical protein
MQNKRSCWSCRYVSIATDAIPGRSNHTCPHCGMEAYQFVPSQLDRAIGSPYFVHSAHQVMRVGRERIQLLLDGYYKNNLLTGKVDKLDAFIPTR